MKLYISPTSLLAQVTCGKVRVMRKTCKTPRVGQTDLTWYDRFNTIWSLVLITFTKSYSFHLMNLSTLQQNSRKDCKVSVHIINPSKTCRQSPLVFHHPKNYHAYGHRRRPRLSGNVGSRCRLRVSKLHGFFATLSWRFHHCKTQFLGETVLHWSILTVLFSFVDLHNWISRSH